MHQRTSSTLKRATHALRAITCARAVSLVLLLLAWIPMKLAAGATNAGSASLTGRAAVRGFTGFPFGGTRAKAAIPLTEGSRAIQAASGEIDLAYWYWPFTDGSSLVFQLEGGSNPAVLSYAAMNYHGQAVIRENLADQLFRALSYSSEGVLLHGFGTVSGDAIFDSPVVVLDNTMLANRSSRTSHTTVTKAGTPTSVTVQSSIRGSLTTTVPAGTFSDVLVLTTEISTSGSATTTTYEQYLAPGVGSVRWAVNVSQTWFRFELKEPPPLIILNTSPLPEGTAQVPYSLQFEGAGGAPPGTLSIVAGRLPAGLYLGQTTGMLEGTPTEAGTFTFTVQLRDSLGHTVEKAFTLVITSNAQPLTFVTTSPLPSGTVGVPYSLQVLASGGVPPYTGSIISGRLPAGLTAHGDTGVLDGTPTESGTFSATVQLRDTVNNTAERTFELVIQPGGQQQGSPWAGYYTGTFDGTMDYGAFVLFIGPNGEGYAVGENLREHMGEVFANFTVGSDGSFLGYNQEGDSIYGECTTTGVSGYFYNTFYSTTGYYSGTKQPLGGSYQTTSGLYKGTFGGGAWLNGTAYGCLLPDGTFYLGFESTTQLPGGGGLARDAGHASLAGSLSFSLTSAASSTLSGTLNPANLSCGGNWSNPGFRGGPSDSGTFNLSRTLTVQDTPPPAPTITTTSPLPSGKVGTSYQTDFAATGGTTPYSWTVVSGSLPVGLNLSSGGSLSGTPTAAGGYSFSIRVTDAASQIAEKPFSLTIQEAAQLTILTTSPLPVAEVAAAYDCYLEASGGASPYAWTVASGSLPPGMILASSGALVGLKGQLSTAGTFVFSLRVTDAASQTAEKSFSLTINASTLPNLTLFTPSGWAGSFILNTQSKTRTDSTAISEDQVVFASYAFTNTSATVGTRSFMCGIYVDNYLADTVMVSSGLSAGSGRLVEDIGLGRLSAGQHTIKVVIDANGTSPDQAPGAVNESNEYDNRESKTFTVAEGSATIPPVRIVKACGFATGTVGVPLTYCFAALDGAPPYLWTSASKEPLPPGLELDSSGCLSGAPTTPGYYTLYLIARSADGSSSEQAEFKLKITDTAVPSIVGPVTPMLPTATNNTPYSLRFQWAQGPGLSGPVSWGVYEGTLPGGLEARSYDPMLIDGTPNAPNGCYTFCVWITQNDASALRTYVMPVVTAPLRFETGGSLPVCKVGDTASYRLETAGGRGYLNFAIVSGGLPEGFQYYADGTALRLYSTGLVATPGLFTFRWKATDQDGRSVERDFSLKIEGSLAPTILLTSEIPQGSVALSYVQHFAAVSGKPPYAWSVSGGELPPGLTLSPQGDLAGIPAGAGVYPLRVRVTGADKLFSELDTRIDVGPGFEWAGLVTNPSPGPGDGAHRIALDQNTNLFVVGASSGSSIFGGILGTTVLESLGEADCFLAKYDRSGNLVWARKAGGESRDLARSVGVDSAGNAYVAGAFMGRQASFEGVTLTGNPDTGGGFTDFLAKYGSNGNLIWAKKLTDGAAEMLDLATDAAGNCYYLGSFCLNADIGTVRLIAPGQAWFLARLDTDGRVKWAQKLADYDSSAGAGSWRLGVDRAGNCLLAGGFSGSLLVGGRSLEVPSHGLFLAKIAAAGTIEWVLEAAETSEPPRGGIGVDGSGNIFLGASSAAYEESPTKIGNLVLTNGSAFLAKFSPTGTPLWAKAAEAGIAGRNFEFSPSLAVDAAGNCYLAGDFNGQQPAEVDRERLNMVAKYDGEGNLLWVQNSGLETAGLASAIAIDPAQNCYVAGMLQGGRWQPAWFDAIALTDSGVTFVAKITGRADPPVITTEPVALQVVVGEDAVLSGQASGSRPLRYQWVKDGTDLPGANSPTLTLRAVTLAQTGQYRLRVTNAFGQAFSQWVSLIVDNALLAHWPLDGNGDDVEADRFHGQVMGAVQTVPGRVGPALTVGAGAYVNIPNAAKLNWTGPITMAAWVKATRTNGTQNILTHGYSSNPGAEVFLRLGDGKFQAGSWDGATVTFASSPILPEQLGRWVHVAGVHDGQRWLLYVDGALAAAKTAATGSVLVNADWAIGAKAGGGERWFYGSIDDVQLYARALSAEEIRALPGTPGQVYAEPPAIATQPQSLGVMLGQTAVFTALATGDEPLSYRWTYNNAPLSDNGRVSGSQTKTLTLQNVVLADAGAYRVVVQNAAGTVTSQPATLTVGADPPLITTQPKSLSLKVGQTATFEVGVSGTTPFTYQWTKNGTNIAGATAATYTLAAVQLADAGAYRVVVQNAVGNVTSQPATLAVTADPPLITGQPQSLTVKPGQPATFQVGVSGTAPFTYKWTKDGTNIAGATAAKYTIAAVQLADAGAYRVVVQNAAGNVTSQPANLTVDMGLIARWPLDGNANDAGSNNLHGEVRGYLPATRGRVDQALEFGGYSYVGIPNASKLNWTGPITMAAWVKATRTNGTQNILAHGYASSPGAEVFLRLVDGKFQAGSWDGVTVAMASAPIQSEQLGRWVHAAGVYDGQQWLLYVDGALAASKAAAKGAVLVNAEWAIGAKAGGNERYFQGVVDDVHLFARALSEAEIRTLPGNPGQPQPEPPIIASQSASLKRMTGEYLSLYVQATGDAPLTYQWLKGDLLLTNNSDFYGCQSASLSLGEVKPADAGIYRVQVANAAGTVVSQPISLAVEEAYLAHWPLDGDGKDATTNHFDGKLIGTVQTVTGRRGQALNLTGAGYVSVPASPALNWSGKISMAAWVKPMRTNGIQNILVHGYGGNPGKEVFLRLADGQFQVGCWDGTKVTMAATPAKWGQWVHVAGIHDGYQWKLYLDGAWAASKQDYNGAVLVDADWAIGAKAGGGERYFYGSIDDVQLYGRVLTESEVRVLSRPPEVPKALLAHWPLEGSAQDDTTNQHHGTLRGVFKTVAGRHGQALEFAGNSYVDISNDSQIDWDGPITMTAWIKLQQTNSTQNILAHGYSSSPGAEVFLRLADGKFQAGSWDGLTPVAASTSVLSSHVGQWVHLAGVYDGQRWLLYLNGGLATTKTTAKGSVMVNANWAIGAKAGGGERFFRGQIDDVRLYSGALTTDEISALPGAPGQPQPVPPTITSQPQSLALALGQNAQFTVQATGATPLSYQWRKGGTALVGATGASYSITVVQASDAGAYTVVVANPAGSVTSQVATLTVWRPPAITSQPQSLTNYADSTACFEVTADGTAPLTYQWRFNGGPIPGALEPRYNLNPVRMTDGGDYSVVVANNYGSVTSRLAVLTVLQPVTPLRFSTQSLSRLPDGRFLFELTSPVGAALQVEATTNLASGSWQTLSILTNANGSAWFVDSETKHKQRFYRLRQTP